MAGAYHETGERLCAVAAVPIGVGTGTDEERRGAEGTVFIYVDNEREKAVNNGGSAAVNRMVVFAIEKQNGLYGPVLAGREPLRAHVQGGVKRVNQGRE